MKDKQKEEDQKKILAIINDADKFFCFIDDNMSAEDKATIENAPNKELFRAVEAARLKVVKEKISSTHAWIYVNKPYWRKNNWRHVTFQCSICKYEVSEWEHGLNSVKVIDGIPSHDMHCNLIKFTCKEYQERKVLARKKKWRKCIQCGVPGCLFG